MKETWATQRSPLSDSSFWERAEREKTTEGSLLL